MKQRVIALLLSFVALPAWAQTWDPTGTWEGYCSDGSLYIIENLPHATPQYTAEVTVVTGLNSMTESMTFTHTPGEAGHSRFDLNTGEVIEATWYNADAVLLRFPDGRQAVMARNTEHSGTSPAQDAATASMGPPLPENVQLRVASLDGTWRISSTTLPDAAALVGGTMVFSVHDPISGRLSVVATFAGEVEEEQLQVVGGSEDTLIVADSSGTDPVTFKFVTPTQIDIHTESEGGIIRIDLWTPTP